MGKTKVIEILNVQNHEYEIICEKQDVENNEWRCYFPKMSLENLVICIELLFKRLNAKVLKFKFKDDDIKVTKKICHNKYEAYNEFLEEISKQLID